MVWDLAQWFYGRSGRVWRWWGFRGAFGKLITLAPASFLALACLAVAGVFAVASWMVILEKTAAGTFRFFQRRFGRAGFVGKVLLLPLLAGALLFCVAVIVLSIGSANPFGRA